MRRQAIRFWRTRSDVVVWARSARSLDNSLAYRFSSLRQATIHGGQVRRIDRKEQAFAARQQGTVRMAQLCLVE